MPVHQKRILSAGTKRIMQIVVKAVGCGAGVGSAGLVIGYHHAVFTSYEKIILCGVFGGFVSLYLAFFISTLLRRPVESDLNTVWALYGVAGYLGAGSMCLVMFTGRGDDEAKNGFISGIYAFVNAGCLLADVVIMQIL